MKNLITFLFFAIVAPAIGQDTASVHIIQQAAGKIIQLRDSIFVLNSIVDEHALLINKYKNVVASDSVQIGMLTKQNLAYTKIIASYESGDKPKWYDTKSMRFVEGFLFAIATVFVATKI